jgi:hypothetical protein
MAGAGRGERPRDTSRLKEAYRLAHVLTALTITFHLRMIDLDEGALSGTTSISRGF